MASGDRAARAAICDLLEVTRQVMKPVAENGTHGTPNDTHDKIAAEAAKKLIDLWKQPSRSPELNKLDLGVWYHLWAKVLSHFGEFLDAMQPEKAQLNRLWEVLEGEFWKVDPAMLLSISGHELGIAHQVIERKGRQLLKEPHAGARKRAAERIAAAKKKQWNATLLR